MRTLILAALLSGCVSYPQPQRIAGTVPSCDELRRFHYAEMGYRGEVFEAHKALSDPGPLCIDGEAVKLPAQINMVHDE